MAVPQHPALTTELMLALVEKYGGNPAQMEHGLVFINTEAGREHYRQVGELWIHRSTKEV
jgi:hypothetical protein